MRVRNASTLFRPFEVFEKAVACGEPLSQALQKLLFSLFKPVLASSKILLSLPENLKAYCSFGSLVDAWLNILHIFYYLDYEQFTSFRPRKGWIIVDVGAYLGFYTLKAARLIGPQGFVVSVEPLAETFKLLSANVKINQLDNVKLIKACVAGSRGTKTLYIPSCSINASILEEYAEAMGGVDRVEKVKAVRLIDIIGRLERVDLLKLDVEGVELEILENSRGILNPNRVKRLIVEVHENIVKPSEVSQILEELGYEVVEYVAEDSLLQVFVYAADTLL